MLFHVELRYRLPLYPALLPYAAWAIAQCTLHIAHWRRARLSIYNSQFAILGAVLTSLALVVVMLLHRPYVGEAWMLARKHAQLWQAERALDGGDPVGARASAEQVLALDPESALARVALARASLARGHRTAALGELDRAISALPAHPYAHLLRGALLREQGDLTTAQTELGYEQASLEDLQDWSWQAFVPFVGPPPAVDIGDGLDLGYVRGFWPAGASGGSRWSQGQAEGVLYALAGADARLDLSINSGRPAGAPAPLVRIAVGGREIGQFMAEPGWRRYDFAVPAELIPDTGRLIVTIRSATFRPRDFDRASPDNRALGVMVGRVELQGVAS
jgi:tetratricopeptide (TPR) repeat protein